jgi:DNA-binding winged helix-turn-helix (wHTH) protein
MALRFADFVFDPERRQLLRSGEEVHLQPRAFKLLEVLLEARPRAVAKRDLMKKLWPDVVVEESNLKTTVSELRTALGSPELIRTVHRYGYAFSGDASTDAPSSRTYRLHGDDLRFSVSQSEAIIGRHPGCDIWIDSVDISRQHARITVRPEAIVIEDLGSKNGTWVGSQRIEVPTELCDGDRIRVADVTLIFRAPAADDSTRTAAAGERR